MKNQTLLTSMGKFKKVNSLEVAAKNEMDVINILRNSKCSLIIDESTDRSCTKHLALICRYFQNGK